MKIFVQELLIFYSYCHHLHFPLLSFFQHKAKIEDSFILYKFDTRY